MGCSFEEKKMTSFCSTILLDNLPHTITMNFFTADFHAVSTCPSKKLMLWCGKYKHGMNPPHPTSSINVYSKSCFDLIDMIMGPETRIPTCLSMGHGMDSSSLFTYECTWGWQKNWYQKLCCHAANFFRPWFLIWRYIEIIFNIHVFIFSVDFSLVGNFSLVDIYTCVCEETSR